MAGPCRSLSLGAEGGSCGAGAGVAGGPRHPLGAGPCVLAGDAAWSPLYGQGCSEPLRRR